MWQESLLSCFIGCTQHTETSLCARKQTYCCPRVTRSSFYTSHRRHAHNTTSSSGSINPSTPGSAFKELAADDFWQVLRLQSHSLQNCRPQWITLKFALCLEITIQKGLHHIDRPRPSRLQFHCTCLACISMQVIWLAKYGATFYNQDICSHDPCATRN